MLKAGMIKSKGEGRRLVQQGGVTVNDEKMTDPYMTCLLYTSNLPERRGAGRRRHGPGFVGREFLGPRTAGLGLRPDGVELRQSRRLVLSCSLPSAGTRSRPALPPERLHR